MPAEHNDFCWKVLACGAVSRKLVHPTAATSSDFPEYPRKFPPKAPVLRILTVIFTLFAKRLRLSNPWNYKAPVLVSVTYLAMLAFEFPLLEALKGFSWSLCTIIGIAGFGYLSNDLGDRDADRKAGKPNLLSELPLLQILALLLLFLALAILPWLLYFPLNLLTVSLLVAEFLLFVLYVLPPFRLKERGLLGVVTDALYAHANPALLAALTFAALAGKEPEALAPAFFVLVGWQLALGMRNILLHQLKDAENDRISGIRTFVTQMGEAKTQRWLQYAFVPLELLSWVALLVTLASVSWLPLLAWPVFLLWQFPKQGSKGDLRQRLYAYLDDYYIPYFPLLILLSLCVQDWRMVVLAVLHVLLFKNALSNARNRLFHWIRKT
jgi:4-hydroxybenzoate polyprenyltransferase